MLSLLYNTGARVQDVVGLVVESIRFSSPPLVTLTGKGSKARVVPLWPTTANLLDEYVRERGVHQKRDARLFINARGQPLTRFGIRHIIKTRLGAMTPK